MRAARFLLTIVLFAGVCLPALPRGARGARMDCCPDGDTMECCARAGGCALENCDASRALPAPTAVSPFLLPTSEPPAPPDPRGPAPVFASRSAEPPISERPDPPPRA